MIHNVDQNSAAWEGLRNGKLTGSEAGDWLLAEPKLTLTGDRIKERLDALGIEYIKQSRVGDLADLLPDDEIQSNMAYSKKDLKARKSAMCKMIRKELAVITDGFIGNKYTDFGHSYEDEAVTEFELRTGYTCKKVGFVTMEGIKYFGVSPDRYVYDSDDNFVGVLEVKCKPEHHVETVIDGVLPDDHKIQVHLQILASGGDKGFFIAYSPDFEPLILEIDADEYTEKLGLAIVRFDREYKAFREANLSKLKPTAEVQQIGKEVA